MNTYEFTVIVMCDTEDEAITIMSSRLDFDEELAKENDGSFTYHIDWSGPERIG